MIARLAALLLLAAFTTYSVLALVSFLRPVDRWMRRQRLGSWSLRSILPFWGLFAQRFGMFDLIIEYRADDSTGTPDWRPACPDRWRWWSFLWRPGLRVGQVSEVLAYQLVAAGLTAPEQAPEHPAYRRVAATAARIRRARGLTATPAAGPPFRIVLSRGHWTTQQPKTVFPPETTPAAQVRRSGGDGGGPEAC